MVGGHAELKALGTPFRLFEQRLVDRSIDHQRCEGAVEATEALNKRLDRLEIREIKRQDDRLWGMTQTHLLEGALRFGLIAAGHHHGPALVNQGFGGPQTDAR